MSTNASNPAAAAAATGFGDIDLRLGDRSSENNRTEVNLQAAAAITALRRDFVAEALRVVSIKAAHAAEDIELGDDVCVERGISLTISHLKAAAATFRQMQNDGGEQ